MMGRNRRGIRRASTRVRLAVAAAVLVGGGAAGVVAVAANHGGAVDAASAGYYSHHHSSRNLSETHAMSDAMDWLHKSPQTSLNLISRMQPMRNVNMTRWHRHTIVLQRGTVVGETRHEFAIKSANNQFEIWHANGGTTFLNVGGSTVGMSAMTGGTMSMPGHMRMNLGARRLAMGDFVFIFGERVHNELVAQLVLFVMPTTVTPTATPTARPSMTTSPTMSATPTVRPTTTATGTTLATPSTT
ncbi:MAG: hypothetical protein ACRDNS_19590, partial [Trebonia sp.]